MLDVLARFNEGNEESFLKGGYQIRYRLDNVKRQENTVKIYNSALDGFISCLYYCSTFKKSKLDLLDREDG